MTTTASVPKAEPQAIRQALGVLFEPFAREETRGSGSAFGLSLAKRMACLLGGDVEVSSEPGVGSTFALTIEAGSVLEESAG